MRIKFGLELKERVYPEHEESYDYFCNPISLIQLLENLLGLVLPENLDFLRVEYYRQTIQQYLNNHPEAFFAESFKADMMACAEAILERRDDLKLSGFDFKIRENMPSRLKTFSEIEYLLNMLPQQFPVSFPDRLEKIIEFLKEDINIDIKEISLVEPLEILPPYLCNLFKLLKNKSVEIIEQTPTSVKGNTDLDEFKKSLLKINKTGLAKGDSSLLIFKSKSDSYSAAFLSKLFSSNPNFRTLCILPNQDRSLDISFIQEGLPSFGVKSASIARPTLQILKLATVFLWTPLNPYKLLEFLSLPKIPLNKGLAIRLAAAVSEKPGLFSNVWFSKKNRFFDELDFKIENSEKKEFLIKERKKAENDYKFWFERKRYNIRSTVPVKQIIELYTHIKRWAIEEADSLKSKIEKLEKDSNKKTKDNKTDDEIELLITQQKSLLSLYSQTEKLIKLLDALPEQEQQLSFLQLERIIKTINDPTSILFRFPEIGHQNYIYNPAAITEDSPNILWWNFIDNSENSNIEYWYKGEREFLKNLGVEPEKLETKNKRNIFQRMQAVLHCQNQLILVIPETINGKRVNPHPLWGDIHAFFGESIENISIEIDDDIKNNQLLNSFNLPTKSKIPLNNIRKAGHFIQINNPNQLNERAVESFTSLESLLFYPYQWAFRYVLNLNKSSILSIVAEETLKGNLAHSIFEKILNEIKISDTKWSKEKIDDWAEKNIPQYFEREGCVLLMYGFEAERRAFINLMKRALWSLINSIQLNNWKIHGIEMDINGMLENQLIKGKADLILKRGEETAVIDLKFKGLSRYRQKIKNLEDIQLVIYSALAAEKKEEWAHTAYFIISSGVIIARNNLAFKEAESLSSEVNFKQVNSEIWNKLISTYKWRISQIKQGLIEIRNKENAPLLDDIYSKSINILDIFELPIENAKYDIYKVIVGNTLN